jgi:hypothetical protein
MTVGDLIKRYLETITPQKRSASSERSRLRAILKHDLSTKALNRVSAAMLAEFREERLKHVQSGTVRRELAVLSHCLEVARSQWGIPVARKFELALP